MRWFFALNAGCPTFREYAQLVMVAMSTARTHTRLQPHFLYAGDDDPPLLDWVRRHGGEVIRRQSRHRPRLAELAAELGNTDILHVGAGAFLRLEVLDVMRERGWRDRRVLYTDCDVMFVGDPEPELDALSVRFFAATGESQQGNPSDLNTGVMLMNVPRLRGQDAAFQDFVRQALPDLVRRSWDQAAYKDFYGQPLPARSWPWVKGWNPLPDTLNWKAYWEANPAARIIHFHGPKAFHAEWLALPETQHPLQAFTKGAYREHSRRWFEILVEAERE